MKKPVLALCAVLTGCAATTPDYPEPSVLMVAHTSPQDGLVMVDYQFSSFMTAVMDNARANGKAQAQCEAWGYTAERRLGEAKTQCLERAPYGCARGVVTVTYQCVK